MITHSCDQRAARLSPCVAVAIRCCLAFTVILLPSGVTAQSDADRAHVKIIVEDDSPAMDVATPPPEVSKSSEQKPDKRSGVPVRWSKSEQRWKPVSGTVREGREAATVYLLTTPTQDGPHPPDALSQKHDAVAGPAPSREKATKSQLTERNARARVLVRWSKSEKRWKPVSPAELRAARTAAREVATYLFSSPGQDLRLQPESAPPETPAAPPVAAAKATSAKPRPQKALTPPGLVTPNSSLPPLNAAVEPKLGSAPLKSDSGGHGLVKPKASSAAVDEVIREAAARHGVDPDLVRAVIKAESNFNSRAVSKKGAMGLMQLTPGTAKRLKVNDPFDPAENVDAGVRHLKSLLASYNGDVARSLAAYNAGPGAVARANGVPNYSETRHYVKQITRLFRGNSPVEASAPHPTIASKAPVETLVSHPTSGNHAPVEISVSRPTTRSSSPARSVVSGASADNTSIRTYRAPDGVLVISDR